MPEKRSKRELEITRRQKDKDLKKSVADGEEKNEEPRRKK